MGARTPTTGKDSCFRAGKDRDMSHTSKQRGWLAAVVLGTALWSGCPSAPPPAPTVAWVQPGRTGVAVERAGQTTAVLSGQRLEEGSTVDNPAGVRSSLYMDAGAWVLLDENTKISTTSRRLTIHSGRAWIDARGGDELEIATEAEGVVLSAKGAGLSVTVAKSGGVQIYCAAGQATWKTSSGGGRLESGLSLLVQNGTAKDTAQPLWDDWTYGLAEPGPLRPLEPAGVGQLTARREDALGMARTPLIVRSHDVRVAVNLDFVTTEIVQTFFNPRSEHLEGLYSVRLPERAILQDFAVGTEDDSPVSGEIRRSAGGGSDSMISSYQAQLEWAGAGQYRAVVRAIQPGKTKVIRVRYAEWLPREATSGVSRRTYVYPMGQSAAALAGGAPNLGEFSLEVDLSRAQMGGLSAGLGATNEGQRVVLRRSDFRPRADFVLDLLDAKDKNTDKLELYRGAGPDGRYLLTQLLLDAGKPQEDIDVVLVVDTSAGTDESRLDLERAAAQAILQQLRGKDRVAVLAASSSPVTLGKEPISAASKERIQDLIAALAKQTPGGASNLEAALVRAVEILPKGRGTVIYIGDGKPTVGALLPGELRDHLARMGALPRFYALGVGSDANVALLGALCDAGTEHGVLRIEDRPEAARAATYLVERAARPRLTDVRVTLGEEADLVYPEGAVSIEAGEALTILGRQRRDRSATPTQVTITGLRAGEPFQVKKPLVLRDMEDGGDLGRRWAQARMKRLLERGAGREAVLDIGERFALVTPWTAMIVARTDGDVYSPMVGEQEQGQFVPLALRAQAPTDVSVALEGGVSTGYSQTRSLNDLYLAALREREAPARLCYSRRTAGRPDLAGRVEIKVRIAPDGIPKEVKVASTTLRSKDIEACIERSISALKLPVAPDGKLHEVLYGIQLTQPDRDDSTHGCSAASRAYLSTRRALWRERLGRDHSVSGAIQVFTEAEQRCELRSWLDRRALLDLMRPSVGTTANQVDLYHRFESHEQQAEIQAYLRREILRSVRTEADVRAAQYGLMLDGGVDRTLLNQELDKAKTVEAKIVVVRQFLALSPGALSLQVMLLGFLESAGKKDEARRLIEGLRSDPGADAAVRQAIGEFLLRQGDGADGARAFSEIVEFAPFDPWGRKRLGDLFLSSQLFEAAYREYQTLGWLSPQDDGVLLMLASAAAGMGRSDEALRLCARVAESVGAKTGAKGPPAWARALYVTTFARVYLKAQESGDKALVAALTARGQSDGLAGFSGKLTFAALSTHPDAGIQLSIAAPGADKGAGERASMQAAQLGLEAQRIDTVEPGTWRLTLNKTSWTSGPVKVEVVAALDAGSTSARYQRLLVTLPAEAKEHHVRFAGGTLQQED